MMPNILNFTPELYFNFFLVFLRLSGLFVTAPILSSESIPIRLRTALVLVSSILLFQAMPKFKFDVALINLADYFLLCLKEMMVGLLLGVIPRVFFAAIEFAGNLIGFQMGLSMANVIDPQTDVQVSVVASLQGILATLLFVVIDGHHIFFEVFALSFEKIPIAGFVFGFNKIEFLLRLTSDLFVIGLQLAAPIVVTLLLANAVMGFMTRSIPQLNVFVVGFPFTIGLGLLFLFFGIPAIIAAFTRLFGSMTGQIVDLIHLMAR